MVGIMFFKQLEHLCKMNKVSISTVINNLGMSKGSITSWRNGVIPNGDTIIKIAEYFNVSTDYLLTGKISNADLSNQEQELIYLFRKLPEAGKERMIGYIEGYIDKNNIK